MTCETTAAASGGAVLRLVARLDPGGFVPPHRHLHQTASFQVREGRARFPVGRRRVYLPGLPPAFQRALATAVLAIDRARPTGTRTP